MKKEWLNPEVKNLGVAETREELNENAKIFCKCQYCNKGFFFWELENHKQVCKKNPANIPVNPLPDGNEEDWIVPVS